MRQDLQNKRAAAIGLLALGLGTAIIVGCIGRKGRGQVLQRSDVVVGGLPPERGELVEVDSLPATVAGAVQASAIGAATRSVAGSVTPPERLIRGRVTFPLGLPEGEPCEVVVHTTEEAEGEGQGGRE